MNGYDIITNAIELISGTANTTSPLYVETAKNINTNDKKALGYIKNFVTDIEKIAPKVNDTRISGSKGNIQKFSGYKNIKTALDFLSKNAPWIDHLKDLNTILKALENHQTQYVDGYNKHVRLVTIEYETSVYMLVTGLVFHMVAQIDVQESGFIMKIVRKKRTGDGGHVIAKMVTELAKMLSSKDHKEYLEELLKSKDNVPIKESAAMTEATIADTIELIDVIFTGVGKVTSFSKRVVSAIKNTIFGIVPLTRSIIYLWYKKKADTILALEQQIHFIEMNITHLQNIKTMDPTKKAEIIKKQQATIEAYRKKSEKLRAELVETEKDAATALKENESDIKKDSSDDFILD